MSKEIRALIFQMIAENPIWGAPRIHGELLKLGYALSEPTVSRSVRRAPRPVDPRKRWPTFLRNHREEWERQGVGWRECFPSTDLLPDKDNDPDGTQWIKSVGAGALGTTPVSGNFGFAHTVEHGYTMLHPQEQRDSALPVTTGRFLRAVGRGK